MMLCISNCDELNPHNYLDNWVEPARVANILQADRAVIEPSSLMRITGVHKPGVCTVWLSVGQAGFQNPAVHERVPNSNDAAQLGSIKHQRFRL